MREAGTWMRGEEISEKVRHKAGPKEEGGPLRGEGGRLLGNRNVVTLTMGFTGVGAEITTVWWV